MVILQFATLNNQMVYGKYGLYNVHLEYLCSIYIPSLFNG